jgi:DNA replication protein DnaC
MRNPEITDLVRGKVEPTPFEIEELNLLKTRLLKTEKDRPEFELKAKYLLAGIPQSYWDIDGQNFRGDPKAKNLVRLYCDHLKEALEQGQGIIFSGQHGTGKTSLACMIGKEALQQGFTVKYISIAKILDMIIEGFDSKQAKERLDTMIERIEFLILDDLGKEYKGIREQLTPMMNLKLDSLLRERLNRIRVTIGTTNYDVKAIKDRYGDSVMSAIYGSCKIVEVGGYDYRMVKGEKFWEEIK